MDNKFICGFGFICVCIGKRKSSGLAFLVDAVTRGLWKAGFSFF